MLVPKTHIQKNNFDREGRGQKGSLKKIFKLILYGQLEKKII